MDFLSLSTPLHPLLSVVFGLALVICGVGVGVWAIDRWARGVARQDERPERESYLAPTLAVDALDSDLRVLYMKSLVLDAEGEDRLGEAWDASTHGSAGREIRRLVVAAQATRVAGDLGEAHRLEHAVQRQLFDGLKRLEDDGDAADVLEDLRERARSARLNQK